MDFTLKIYKELLTALQSQGFSFQTFEQYANFQIPRGGTTIRDSNRQIRIIENYPESTRIMKENPDYQYNFR